MGPGIWQILGKEYSLGEGGKAAWEGSAAKRPGNSVWTDTERKAGEDGLLGKVKLNIANSNLQRRWESVSYNEVHQLSPVISVHQVNLLSHRDCLVNLQRQYVSITISPAHGR